jgi:hypothetical protein
VVHAGILTRSSVHKKPSLIAQWGAIHLALETTAGWGNAAKLNTVQAELVEDFDLIHKSLRKTQGERGFAEAAQNGASFSFATSALRMRTAVFFGAVSGAATSTVAANACSGVVSGVGSVLSPLLSSELSVIARL